MKWFFAFISLFLITYIGFGQNELTVELPNLMFSDSGGIYSEPISLEISSSGDKIFYTTDGNLPSSSSKKYASPIEVKETTVVRAIAYKEGRRGQVITQTYIIGRRYDMAVISIVGNPDDFFSYERGIYSKGCCADSIPPYRGANFWKGWERRVNIEFYEPTGEQTFNQEVGIRIFGGFSKGLPMKSLAIIARKKYGDNRMRYSIFPDKEIKKYKSIVLRNSGSDFNNTHFRDALLTHLVAPLDIEIQAYRPAVVFINGKYWGIHNVREKINEYYLKSNCNANRDSVDIMKHRNDLLAGVRDNYLSMKRYIAKTDFSDTVKIRHLNTLMDVDNFINYNITEVFIDNRDAGGNIRYWRPQTTNGRWRWILFDTDISFGIAGKNTFKKNTLDKMTNKHNEIWPDPPWSTLIIRNLLENDSIKNVYINRFSDHLNTIFSTKMVHEKIDSIQSLLNYEMPFHFKKWRSCKMKSWEKNVQKMRDFATYRPQYVRLHLMKRFNLTDTFTIEIQNSTPNMGFVQVNSIQVNDNFKGIYFKEVPVSIIAVPKYGYEFEKWERSNEKKSFLLKDDAIITPVFKKQALSPFTTKIVFNELSAHQDSTFNHEDWIELYNNSNNDLDISKWKFVSNDNEIIFPDSTIIKAGSYFIVARNPDSLSLFLKEDNISLFSIKNGISSISELLLLLDIENKIVDSLRYNFQNNFPDLSRIESKNIERINPSKNQWFSSSSSTPGRGNDLYEPIEIIVKDKKVDWLIYVGVGILFLGILLLFILIIKKKKKK